MLVLGAFAFVSSGCHELYCNFAEGLTGLPLECDHDAVMDPGDAEIPPLPPPPQLPQRTATIDWQGPVVAGQPQQFTATGAFGPDDHPLRYRWDLDNDGAYDDHEGVGDDGRVATPTFDAEGQRTIGVQVTRASDTNPARENTAIGATTFNVAPGEQNPLEIDIQLSSSIAPPEERPVVDVRATVTQDGQAVSGANVGFDFETDGTTDASATSSGEGRAFARHDYPNGEHTVTVTAQRGEETGSASRTFTYNDGEITTAPKVGVRAAAARRFTAALGLTPLKEGTRTRHGRKVRRRGELSIGGLVGHVKGGTPASLKGLLKSTWVTSSTITYNRRTHRARVTGVALVTFVDAPGQGCVSYSVSTRVPGRSGKFRMTLLGGTDAAATTRAVATGRVSVRGRRFALKGKVSTKIVPPRGLTRACRSLRAAVLALPA